MRTAGQMSTPIPSPSTNGMLGSSGTDRVPSDCILIFLPMGTQANGPQPPRHLLRHPRPEPEPRRKHPEGAR